MSNTSEENLSALFDGEVSEFELHKALKELDNHALEKWQRYQLISDAASSQLQGSHLSIDVSAAVAEAIADENVPAVLEQDKKSSLNLTWLKPLTGFAAAASIAFITVVSVQNLDPSSVDNSGFVADGNVNSTQFLGTNTGLSQASADVITTPVDQASLDQAIREEQARLQKYMEAHSIHASFNNSRGLLPMARLATEEY